MIRTVHMIRMIAGSVGRAVVSSRAVWWAPALVAAISGTLIGLCLVQSASVTQPDVRAVIDASHFEVGDVSSVGDGIPLFTVPTALIVMALVASAAVGQLTEDLARWRIAGASPLVLACFVMVQLLLVSLLGGIVAAVVTGLLGGPVSAFLNAMTLPELADVHVHVQAGPLVWTAVIPPLVMLGAGLLPASRGGRVPAVRAVVGEEEKEPRVGALRWIGTGVGAAGLVAVTWASYGAPTSEIASGSTMSIGLGICVMVLVTAGLGARTLVPLLLAAWTRLVPTGSTGAAPWQLARAGARARARVSGSTVVALASGSGILGMLAGMGRTSEATARAMGSTRAYNYLDIYVICGIIGLMCAVGGVCVLALNARNRRQEIALLRAAGMSPGQVTAMVVCEAVALAGTAILVALVATLLPVGLLPWTAWHQGLPVRFVVPWAELGIAAVVTVLAVLIALLAPARRGLRSSVRESLAAV